MNTIAINVLNSNSGGGKSIRDSYLMLLNERDLKERYVVITAKGADLGFITNPNIKVMEMPGFWSWAFMAPLIYRFALARVLRSVGADVVFNMGDLIVYTDAKQLYIFDWAYALDVHPKVWSDMKPLDWLNRRVKLWLITRDLRKPDIVIALTDFISKRLKVLYDLQDVRVINNAVTINTTPGDGALDISLPTGGRLVYPTVYYPHKNLEKLLELADLIKTRKLDYRIVTTVNPDTHASRRFLDSIAELGLQDIITNVGQVPLNQMHSLYGQCDALLMPTLLESFSIVYLEAMHHGLPLFTSDMWFARAVCDEAAVYFDPFDAQDMLRALEEVMPNPSVKRDLTEAGARRLASFPTWEENFATYQQYIFELLGGLSCAPNRLADITTHKK